MRDLSFCDFFDRTRGGGNTDTRHRGERFAKSDSVVRGLATTGAQYSGAGLPIIPTEHGARLHCVFQRLYGEATQEGLWLTSTVTNQAKDRFRVTAAAIGEQVLSQRGEITVDGQIVRFSRPRLIEEYSVSMDGVRQDFLVLEKLGGASVPASRLASSLAPPAHGQLRVELAVTGARVEQTAHGAQLVLESGRKIAYSRLRVTDAAEKELPARIEVTSTTTMTVVVNDSNAVYPVRIDPTFSDANWVNINPSIPGANDAVYAAVVDGSGNLYIGGRFSVVGNVIANRVAKWDGSTWSALGLGVGVIDPANHWVSALAVSGSDLYVGGTFTTATNSDGVAITVNRVAKWNGSNWNALGLGVGESWSDSVSALAVSGNDLYVGGNFDTATDGDGTVATVNRIAKWNGSTWSPVGLGMDSGVVGALAISGTNLYVGGSFLRATNGDGGLIVANRIAKWDGNTWSPLGLGMDNWVGALALSGTNLYVGGSFLRATNGDLLTIPANRIAKWDGNAWSALGMGIGGGSGVSSLAVSGSNVYAGGRFSTAGSLPANCVARWNGSSWSAMGGAAGVNVPEVFALAALGNDVFVGGEFTTVTSNAVSTIARRIVKWNNYTWTALGSGMDDWVSALAVSGSDVYVGGAFKTVGSASNQIAKWNGTVWTPLGTGMNSNVSALAVSGSNLYAAGLFTRAGTAFANYVARWNGTSWSAMGQGMNGSVTSLAVSGSNVFAGGWFTTAGSVAAKNVARWNGSSWSAMGPGLNGLVLALAASGNDVYAGANFVPATGLPSGVAKWNGTNWSILGGMSGQVMSLAISGQDVYVGGDFTFGGGQPANHIVKWNGIAWSTLGSGMNDIVYALAISGNDLYAGGLFSMAGGSIANSIAKWNGSSWSPLGSGVNGTVHALAVSGSDIYVGGDFHELGGKVSGYIAKWAPLAFRANSVAISNGTFQALLTGPDTNSVVVDSAANFADWTPVVTNTLPPGGALQLSLTGTNSHLFYRARLGP